MLLSRPRPILLGLLLLLAPRSPLAPRPSCMGARAGAGDNFIHWYQ